MGIGDRESGIGDRELGIGDRGFEMGRKWRRATKSYKELEIWKKAVDLAVEVYRITRAFPPQEKFGLASQMQRAATSIPANIAEGWGRGSTKEYVQFLRMARASLMELETHLILTERLGYLQKNTLEAHQQEVAILGKGINALIRSLLGK